MKMNSFNNQPVVNNGYSKFGYVVSMITAILTIITFAVAICTPPLSGPFCAESCFEYPFHEIAGRFPRDYYWMFLAIILSIFYLIMIITIYHVIPENKKLFGMLGCTFAIMSALILIVDYFVQVSVIQPSLIAGETDGISILTQFNPHGIFIVIEEIGFMFMILSFFVMIPIFNGQNKLEKAIKWMSIISFVFAIISFTLISISFGIYREYRFEVVVISIAWIELIIISIFFSKFFLKKE